VSDDPQLLAPRSLVRQVNFSRVVLLGYICIRAFAFTQPWYVHWDQPSCVFAGAIFWSTIVNTIRELHWSRRWNYAGLFLWAGLILAVIFHQILAFWLSISAMIAMQEILLYPPTRIRGVEEKSPAGA
jgi:hypothetical protein